MTTEIRFDLATEHRADVTGTVIDHESRAMLLVLSRTWQRRNADLALGDRECMGHDSAGEPDQGFGYPRTVYCDGSCRRR